MGRPKGGGRARWLVLLEDRNFKRWHDNLARGSLQTANNLAGVLYRFLTAVGLSPAQLVAMKAEKRNDLVTDYIADLLAAKKSPSYAKNHKVAIASWLSWNGQALTRPIKITVRTTMRRAHLPSQEELRQVLNAADARARAAIGLLAFSGLRLEVLGNYDGTDALRLSDFPEATLKEGIFHFEKVPTRINVREELSKTKRSYTTFLGPEGCEYVSSYVRERHEAGEQLHKDSPLFAPRKVEGNSMKTNSISVLVRRPMRLAGMKNNPPYIWRSYHGNRTMMAESDGLSHDMKVYMTGHVGSLEVQYGLRKALPPDVVDRMRHGYQTALKYLETTNLVAAKEPSIVLTSSIMRIAGHSPEKVASMKVDEKSEEERVELMRDAWRSMQLETRARQKTISADDLDTALEAGWTYKTTLPNGRILIETIAA